MMLRLPDRFEDSGLGEDRQRSSRERFVVRDLSAEGFWKKECVADMQDSDSLR